jgi:hypothetical protein
MKTLLKPMLLVLALLILPVFHPFQTIVAQQESVSPTPTYDPLVEPPLPENPTEIELGRNLYWHWCMTCHGDYGQGLTDEFRSIWVPDHQNCWGRGCHAGRPGDTGFRIPTIVPALVNDSHLAQFTSVQQLSNFLKATHPPQSPGILEDAEYHAIAIFVFTMNERSLINIPVTDTPVPTLRPTQTLIPPQDSVSNSLPIYAVATFAMLMLGVFAWARRSSINTNRT